MTAETVVVISGVVAGAVQVLKKFGIEQKQGMVYAVGLSIVAVLLYGISNESAFTRALVWPYFAAIVAVSSAAVGIHSLTKNTQEMISERNGQ